MESSDKFKKLEQELKDGTFDPSKHKKQIEEAFDEEGKLIEGKELDPNGEMSVEDKLAFAQEMISYDQQVRQEEESLLKKMNDAAEQNAKLPRKQKRERLRRAISDYKIHFRTKPKIDINDDDQTSFDKTIALRHWMVRKGSLENIILRYGTEAKLKQAQKDVEKLS